VERKTEKTTQGHQKMLQYIEDLKRNKPFLKIFRKYDKQSSEEKIDNVFFIIKEYEKLNKITKKLLKKYESDYEKITVKMAEEYGLDSDLLNYIHFSLDKKLNKCNLYKNDVDMCVYNDNYDESLGYRTLPDVPLILNRVYRNHLRAYPISIDIHKYASKRDVLDFIEKKWDWIYKNNLGFYTEYEKIRFRKRKQNQKIIDFIWNNKRLKAKEIKVLLDKEFPHNGLVYYEINKIISIEKDRRLRK